jgi:hypothetical protein
MDPEVTRRLKELYNRLADEPLDPESPYYEPFHEQMHDDGDPIATLATSIAFAEGESVSLLSGQRGAGKSTELRRLRKRLQDKDKGCVVLMSDMRDYLNLNAPLEVTDFLIALMGGFAKSAAEFLGHDPTEDDWWDRMVHFLQTDLEVSGSIELPLGLAKVDLKGSLKEDPTFKSRLQKALRGHVARLKGQAHDFAKEVVTKLRAAPHVEGDKIVFLVDSVEQIRGVGPEAEDVYRSVANVFSTFSDALRLPLMHVVYTIPPYLTALAPSIGGLYGGMIYTLPSIRVRSRTGKEDQQGLELMRRIVQRRHERWREFLSVDQVDSISLATGGDLRDFFRLLRYCLARADSADRLPISDRIVTQARQHLRREMQLSAEDRKWLAKIAKTKRSEMETVTQLPHLARFLDSHVVLNYRNGDGYDVHPLLQDELRES